ncbi:MAG TPA: hypothetical protein VL793_09430 [Patescibacteria group bacterium]|nr:hypothetical protein [Patescibacteria group bacterium]
MKARVLTLLPFLAFAFVTFTANAQFLQLVSVPDPSVLPPSGGNGDSYSPILTPDGRFVLFASTANNLAAAGTNNVPAPDQFPAHLNVYLSDRTKGTVTLVSVNFSGFAAGNGDSTPLAVSTNGQFVLFESGASDLVSGDTNNAADIFIRDVLKGTTTLISVNTNGNAGNGLSGDGCFTPDGRYVAFVSQASDLVPGDTNRLRDVFVRDTVAGTTVLASVGAVATNSLSLQSSSEGPEISDDGHYVAFFSSATNLVSGVPPGGDVYVRDLTAGMTIWASQGARAAALTALGRSNVVSSNHRLGSDSRFVAYETSLGYQSGGGGLILRFDLSSGLTDLIYTNAAVQITPFKDSPSIDITPDGRFIAFIANTNGNSGETTCVQVWDSSNGSLKLASGDTNGFVQLNSTCLRPVLDSTGRLVTFLSNASGLVSNSVPGEFHLYQHDLQSGSTALVDADTEIGSSLGSETIPSISADGLLVVFSSADASLMSDRHDQFAQIFVHNMAAGTNELTSAHSAPWPSRTPTGSSAIMLNSISGDGRFVVCSSEADDLVPGDTNQSRDVFVRDLLFATNLLVTANTNGVAADGVSGEAVLTPDGRYVAFASFANDLAADDSNQTSDIFVRDLQTGTTTLESRSSAGAVGNGPSSLPRISVDGRYVLFRSWAKNLGAGIVNYENLLLRDRREQTNYALTTSGANLAAMTPDGGFVAFIAASRSVSALNLNVWDSGARKLAYANANISSIPIQSLAIRPDGGMVAYGVAGALHILDLATTNNQVANSGAVSYQQLRFGRDGALLTYAAIPALNTPSQVYLLDLQTGIPMLVSHALASSGAANDNSDSPDISADGRFIAYRSSSSDLVQGLTNTNSTPNIFLFDRLTGNNSLLSKSTSGDAYANNRSIFPVFSADGHALYFTTWATDLAAQDLNRGSDLFAFSFFYALIVPASPAGSGSFVSWPYVPGKNYEVQFKNNLTDSNWQPVNGTVTNYGNRAWLIDSGADAQKFLRVRSF